MPRRARINWHPRRRRWYSNIGARGTDGKAKEVFAPEDIGEKEEGRAWAWFDAEKARRDSAETPIPSGTLTVEALCTSYLEWAEGRIAEGKLSEKHYDNKDYHLTRFVRFLGDREAITVAPEDIEAFISGMQKEGLAPTYVDNICATVSAAFNWAARFKHLPTSPIRGFELPAVPDSPERYAERIEAAAWLGHFWRRSRADSVAGRYDRLTTLMQRVMIRSGSRPGELCVLLWSDIKWAGWTSSAGHACARAVIPPERWKAGRKTGKARTIFFSPILTRALRREKDRPDRHPVYVFIKGRGRGGKGAGEPWPDSSILARKVLDVRRELICRQAEIRDRIGAGAEVTDRERRLAGIEIRDEGPNRVTNYRWRHTAISSLLMMGVDVPTVADLTGTSPQMIYSTYGHLLSSHLHKAAEALATGRRRS